MALTATDFDPVHDIQRSFREIVKAFSFPGRIVDLREAAAKTGSGGRFPAAMLVAGRMLLDNEATFACPDDTLADMLSVHTFSMRKPVACADFVFADGMSRGFAGILGEIGTGDLVDPHKGATVVAAAEFGEEGDEYELSGPGIETVTRRKIALAEGWCDVRSRRNREFPMGFDMILIDRDDRAMALPRTTRVAKAVP